MKKGLRVMVVDDDPILLKALRRQIEKLGYPCQTCASAEEALERRRSESYRILLCDWELPGLSGPELCRTVRMEDQYSYVLLLTGAEGPESKIQALDAGADAFLSKPASPADLRAHLQIAQRILDLQCSLESQLRELETSNRDLREQIELRQQAETSRDHLARSARDFELRVAAHVQNRLLVAAPPFDPFLDIAAYSRPSREVDGDFLDFFRHRSGLDCVVGDVMGKGVPAALLGAGMKTRLLRVLAEQRCSGVDRVITQLNQLVCEDLVSLESFVTLFYARFDQTAHTLSFVDAGHTKPLLHSRRSETMFELEGPNCPLGFTPYEHYHMGQVNLKVGDRMLLFSDGLTEAKNPEGEQWGLERLKASFLQAPDSSAQACLEHILAAYRNFADDPGRDDDLSLIVVDVFNLPHSEALRVVGLEFPSELACLEELRDFVAGEVTDFLAGKGDEVWIFQLQLAVTELASNIVRHAYGGKRGHWLYLVALLFAEEVVVRMYHAGEPVPQEYLVHIELESPREGGMGMFLIQRMTDRLEVGDQRGAHWVEFSKRFPEPGATDAA